MHTWRHWQAPVALLASLLVACAHGEPFGPAGHSSTDPFEPGVVPLRLTYGGGRTPAWMPDGTQFVYAYDSPDHANHGTTPDTCLGFLPASGGQRSSSVCSRSAFEADTLNVYQQPTPSPDGKRLAFLRGLLNPITRSGLTGLVVGLLDSLPDGEVIANDGFPGPHGQVQDIGQLRWLDSTELVFLGSDDAIVSPCPNCDPTVIRRWRDAYRLAASGSVAPEVVPGTEFATSVAVGPAAALYLTFANDGRVVQRDLNSGAETVITTFAPGATPRDADYANGRIALIAGGVIVHLTDDEGQPAQGEDKGGELQVVDAVTGAVTSLPSTTLLFRRPRWSPDGTALLAEGYAFEEVTIVPPNNAPVIIDTVVSATADIYRVQVP